MILVPQHPFPNIWTLQKHKTIRGNNVTVHAIGFAKISNHRKIQKRFTAKNAELDLALIKRPARPINSCVDYLFSDRRVLLPELLGLITISAPHIAVLRHQEINRGVFLLPVCDRGDIKHAITLIPLDNLTAL
jgi:hypothetical protein